MTTTSAIAISAAAISVSLSMRASQLRGPARRAMGAV